jgi:hypothetical protein
VAAVVVAAAAAAAAAEEEEGAGDERGGDARDALLCRQHATLLYRHVDKMLPSYADNICCSSVREQAHRRGITSSAWREGT